MKSKLSLTILLLSCFFLDIRSDSEKDEAKLEKITHPLPQPCYISKDGLLGIGSFFFALPIIVCLIVMLIPFPKIFFLHNFITVGLGMYLLTMHLLGIIFDNTIITRFCAVLLGGFCAISGMSEKASSVPLICIGTYAGGYLIVALFDFTSFNAYIVACVLVLLGLIALKFLLESCFLVVVKTILCLLSVMIVIEILTPLNLISSIHGNTWFFESFNRWISKLIIVIGGAVLFCYNYFLAFYCS